VRAPESDGHAVDKVVKATTEEALRFGKVDAEIRNALQGVKIADLETTNLEAMYHAKKLALSTQKISLLKEVERLQVGYTTVVQELADKYGIDPKHMTIDPDTGVIHDLRGEVKLEEG
jgi:hypothetical protein